MIDEKTNLEILSGEQGERYSQDKKKSAPGGCPMHINKIGDLQVEICGHLMVFQSNNGQIEAEILTSPCGLRLILRVDKTQL